MHIKENLINFLYDRKYFISIYEDYIHIFKFREINKLSSEEIILKMDDFLINIKGEKLVIKKLMPDEMLIKGKLESFGITYE